MPFTDRLSVLFFCLKKKNIRKLIVQDECRDGRKKLVYLMMSLEFVVFIGWSVTMIPNACQ